MAESKKDEKPAEGTQGKADPTTPSQADAAKPLNADGQKTEGVQSDPTPENAGTTKPGVDAGLSDPDTGFADSDQPDPEVRAQQAQDAEKARAEQAAQSFEEYPDDKKQFEGQSIVTEHFVVLTDVSGLEVKPRGYVGDGLKFSAAYVSELKDALGKVKNLPKD
jgi:hypothetical protein